MELEELAVPLRDVLDEVVGDLHEVEMRRVSDDLFAWSGLRDERYFSRTLNARFDLANDGKTLALTRVVEVDT